MNRKNLTAAVLAGLAGVAGIASTAQAVNLNPDGLGEVLIYPYYTTKDGNQTLLSVVNTTDDAKAVKIRFLEAYNSREVLDFNIYLSPWDVWVGAIADSGAFGAEPGVPHLAVPDTTCTVPYLYGMGMEEFGMGLQPFLLYAYTGDNEDGGPTDIARSAEGYFEIIEMGTMTDDDKRSADTFDDDDPGRIGSATAATHVLDDEDGTIMPEDCELLVRNWTDYDEGFDKDDPYDGWWFEDSLRNDTGSIVGDCDDPDDDDTLQDLLDAGCGQTNGHYSVTDSGTTVWIDSSTEENSGGLFGSASVVNVARGTMYSYDARAIQGFDNTDDGIHFIPGTIHPSLNDGNNNTAYVNLGEAVVPLDYPLQRTVEAISAVFMHDNLMNQFTIEEELSAATEWVLTHPTKSWYVDPTLTSQTQEVWEPDPNDEGCNGWDPGEPFPPRDGPDVEDQEDYPDGANYEPGWEQCTYVDVGSEEQVLPPFTEIFDGEACEEVSYENWDREESPSNPDLGLRPPVVSPAPPTPPDEKEIPFELCYEVNVLRFGDTSIFGSDLIADGGIALTVEDTPKNGWARINFELTGDWESIDGEVELDDIELHQDRSGLIGLPTTGFSAEQYVNGTLGGGSVLANYGGLFGHKGTVLRDLDALECEYHRPGDVCNSSSEAPAVQ
jgi:hypothetical protein